LSVAVVFIGGPREAARENGDARKRRRP